LGHLLVQVKGMLMATAQWGMQLDVKMEKWWEYPKASQSGGM
jgi:hypothetical protein